MTLPELSAVLHSLDQEASEEDVAAMIAEVDVDGSGSIDFTEFLTLMAKKKNPHDVRTEMKHVFDVFDKDGDGFISVEELHEVTIAIGQPIDEKELREILNEADVDRDGVMSWPEFLRIVLYW